MNNFFSSIKFNKKSQQIQMRKIYKLAWQKIRDASWTNISCWMNRNYPSSTPFWKPFSDKFTSNAKACEFLNDIWKIYDCIWIWNLWKRRFIAWIVNLLVLKYEGDITCVTGTIFNNSIGGASACKLEVAGLNPVHGARFFSTLWQWFPMTL